MVKYLPIVMTLLQTMNPANIEAGLFFGGARRLMGGKLALLLKV